MRNVAPYLPPVVALVLAFVFLDIEPKQIPILVAVGFLYHWAWVRFGEYLDSRF